MRKIKLKIEFLPEQPKNEEIPIIFTESTWPGCIPYEIIEPNIIDLTQNQDLINFLSQ